jgi:hypothetical protein
LRQRLGATLVATWEHAPKGVPRHLISTLPTSGRNSDDPLVGDFAGQSPIGAKWDNTYMLKSAAEMSGIQFVTDNRGGRVAVQIDLKKHGALWQDFWDGLIANSRSKEKCVPYEQYRASRFQHSRSRG